MRHKFEGFAPGKVWTICISPVPLKANLLINSGNVPTTKILHAGTEPMTQS